MASRDDIIIEITPQVLLKAYACGIFPMAESADDPALYWIEPQQRGILLLDRPACAPAARPHHPPGRVRDPHRQRLRGRDRGLLPPPGPAGARPGSTQDPALYRDLFDAGYCHTVETWLDGKLVGGLYGVALNGAFFGESMFSTARDASKVALVYLCARLIHGGFSLLDTQFVTEHWRSSAPSRSIAPNSTPLLEKALAHEADFHAPAEQERPPRARPRHHPRVLPVRMTARR